MKRIALVYFDEGGGHRNATMALDAAIQQSHLPWEVQLVNLQELLDSIDFIRRYTGLRMQDVYNRMLQNGGTLGSTQLMRVLQGVIRIYHSKTVRLLKEYWRGLEPDLVVIPNSPFKCLLLGNAAGSCPESPSVTVLTEIADYPPHFLIA